MQEDRRDAAETYEDGGGGDEEYEEIKILRKTVGSGGKVAIISQHTKTKNKCETLVMIQDK